MTLQGWLRTVIAASVLSVAGVAAAQQSVTSNDIQRLQDQVYQTGTDVGRLRSTNSTLAGRLESELDDLRDEVVYLKVKMRKEGSVSRTEYSDVRDRLQDLRSQARGEAASAGNAQGGRPEDRPIASESNRTGGYEDRRSTSSSSSSSGKSAIPVGQEIDVRLQKELTSDTAQVEDRFEATTAVDLYQGNVVLIPAGSVMRGVVSSVNRASRTDRKGSMTVAFDQVTVNGRAYPMRGTVTQALESEGIKGEIGRIGAGSAVGAIIGGIIGGTKGALLGVLIGGGGTIAATEGKDVHLPAGTLLRVRMDTPPNVTVRSGSGF
jgi:TolA-binding protein